jgi:hypothetical protein
LGPTPPIDTQSVGCLAAEATILSHEHVSNFLGPTRDEGVGAVPAVGAKKRPSPRLAPSGVSAEAIQRPFISRSRTSTQKVEQLSRSTVTRKVQGFDLARHLAMVPASAGLPYGGIPYHHVHGWRFARRAARGGPPP